MRRAPWPLTLSYFVHDYSRVRIQRRWKVGSKKSLGTHLLLNNLYTVLTINTCSPLFIIILFSGCTDAISSTHRLCSRGQKWGYTPVGNSLLAAGTDVGVGCTNNSYYYTTWIWPLQLDTRRSSTLACYEGRANLEPAGTSRCGGGFD